MRTDPSKSTSFQQHEAWNLDDLQIRMHQPAEPEDGEGPAFRAIPFSGGERNRLFLRRHGNFKDVTLVSGADFREDGRGFALLDFNQDGFLDMAVVSPNEPRFRLVQNFLPAVDPRVRDHHALRIRLIGGNTGIKPTRQWSARDPYGAVVKVTIGDTTSAYQLSSSEGLSSQNSRWIHVGMGTATQADRVEVIWPSGKRSELTDISAGEISIHESDAATSEPDRAE